MICFFMPIFLKKISPIFMSEKMSEFSTIPTAENSIEKSTRESIREKLSSKNGMILIVEANIGAGKTVLCSSIEKYLKSLGIKTIYYPEFINQSLLELYLSNQSKYAFDFQTIQAMTRKTTVSDAIEKFKQGYFCIIDRGLIGDFSFASLQRNNNNFTNEEWRVYNNLIFGDQEKKSVLTNFITHSLDPSQLEDGKEIKPLVLFLDCSPEICFQRMIKRNRKGEIKGYNLEYFKDLDKYHRMAVKEFSDRTVFYPYEKPRVVKNNGLEEEAVEEILNHIL